ncbi:type VII secretion integral membrane protein EccD [Rhodococcus erythropolis]|uniref:Type VII secretion integral membrane protein EccD n=1 Tax=Mycolicibacterium frederiksbergense TaxID=117567 RepID=A0A6H0RYL9_9MYCO|nr:MULTISPECIES: type VII secretion integral membrane protein EccD [Mycobacteriales]MBY6388911.1 type VII secretion integral membrane protein EccD [Rhodococcus erythropolis]QIV79581.1 type VII secretion integral membrane protein EccD [Mycolicibacterium frederiksbergense]
MSVVLPVESLPADPSGQPESATTAVAAVPEQIRVAIHVGNYNVDTSLAAHAPLSIVMEGLVPFLSDTLRSEGLAVDFTTTGVYTLAVEGGMPFARTLSLAEAGVLDGARLLLREVHSTEVFKPIIEDGSDALAEFNAVKFASFTADTARVLGLIAIVGGAALTAALTIAAWWSTPSSLWWVPPSAALTLLSVVGAVVAARRSAPAVSYVAGIAAVLLAFAVGWVAVPAYENTPGHWTAANVMAAAFTAAAVSLMVLWLTNVGITVHTAAVTLAVAGAAAAGVLTFTEFDLRQIGTVAVVVGMIVVVSAPGLSLLLAGVKPPSLPVPGEDIDRNELDEAAMMVEVFDDGNDVRTVALSDDEDTQLEGRSRVSNKYLTGLFAAAVIVIVTGAVVAVEPHTHYFWGEVAVAILSILVLVFRGRSLPDRVHAVTFFVGAFILLVGFTLTIITGTSNVVAEISVLGGVVAVAILAALAAMLLPGRKMSPITLRRIEYLEFVTNMAVAMLAFWIVGAFAFFRNLL